MAEPQDTRILSVRVCQDESRTNGPESCFTHQWQVMSHRSMGIHLSPMGRRQVTPTECQYNFNKLQVMILE